MVATKPKGDKLHKSSIYCRAVELDRIIFVLCKHADHAVFALLPFDWTPLSKRQIQRHVWIGVGYFNPTFSIASFNRSFITLHISQETKSAENVKLRIKLLAHDQKQTSLEFKSGNLESEKFFRHRFSPAVWHNPSPLRETIDSPACYIRYICALCSGRTHNHSNVLHYWKPLQLTNQHWRFRTSNGAISFFIKFCRVCVTWNIA